MQIHTQYMDDKGPRFVFVHYMWMTKIPSMYKWKTKA